MNIFKYLSTIAASTVLLTYGTIASTQAAQLGTANLNPSGSLLAPNAINGNIRLTLSISDNPQFPSSTVPPRTQVNILGPIITTADIGRTFTFTPEQDPNFNDFASLLTDGRRSVVSLFVNFLDDSNLRVGFGIGLNESSFSDPGVGAIDFFGNTIDSLDLRLNSLEVSNTAPESKISVGTTLTINGQPVPEPNSNVGTLVIAVFGVGYTVERLRRNASTFT